MIKIKYAKPADAKQIAICHIASWQRIYRGLMPDHVIDSLSVKEDEPKWHQFLNSQVKTLALEKNDCIIGFASLQPSREKGTPQQCAEITMFYLHPDFWRQGLGKKLWQAVLSELIKMGFSEVILWVLKDNEQAKKFYLAMGFVETHETKLEPYNKDVFFNEVKYYYRLLKN